jgi:perosamine synthetase
MSLLSNNIKNAIKSVLGEGSFSLHKPVFSGKEYENVKECINSTFVSSVGNFVDNFERELEYFTGAKRAIAVVNGTAALQVALKVAGVQINDEVIVPALTFVATANAVNYLGAKPHFVDSNEATLGIDPFALREWLKKISEPAGEYFINKKTGNRLSALVPMHTFGHPCNIHELLAIAHDYKLKMVEDSAESLGSFYDGRHTGTFGLLGIISFNGNKLLTTGGGGAILTNNENIANHIKHLTTTAKISHPWNYVHDEIGYNFRMPNINAALGCAQLEQINTFLSSKRRLYYRYENVFNKIKNVKLMAEPINCKSNYWLQTLILSEKMAYQKDNVLKVTNEIGLSTRPSWTLINKLKPYNLCQNAPLPIAESLSKRIINIPSGSGLA